MTGYIEPTCGGTIPTLLTDALRDSKLDRFQSVDSKMGALGVLHFYAPSWPILRHPQTTGRCERKFGAFCRILRTYEAQLTKYISRIMFHTITSSPQISNRMPAGLNSSSNGHSPNSASVGRAVGNGQATKHTPWTFLSNHAHVLILLYAEPELVLREVGQRVGITERAVQRIVQELEEEGFLTRERIGRRNRYHIDGGKHLRHHIESHCTIDQLLKLVIGNSASRPEPQAH